MTHSFLPIIRLAMIGPLWPVVVCIAARRYPFLLSFHFRLRNYPEELILNSPRSEKKSPGIAEVPLSWLDCISPSDITGTVFWRTMRIGSPSLLLSLSLSLVLSCSRELLSLCSYYVNKFHGSFIRDLGETNFSLVSVFNIDEFMNLHEIQVCTYIVE